MKQIPKYQNAGKFPNYYYQTIDTTNGNIYNVRPSALNAKNIEGTMTLPDIKITARHPSYQYKSAFDPIAA